MCSIENLSVHTVCVRTCVLLGTVAEWYAMVTYFCADSIQIWQVSILAVWSLVTNNLQKVVPHRIVTLRT